MGVIVFEFMILVKIGTVGDIIISHMLEEFLLKQLNLVNLGNWKLKECLILMKMIVMMYMKKTLKNLRRTRMMMREWRLMSMMISLVMVPSPNLMAVIIIK